MKKCSSVFGFVVCFLMLGACSTNYYSVEDFGKVKKIDAHTHLDSKNTAFANQAKIDNFLLVSINTDIPGEITLEDQFDAASFLQSRFPENIRFLTSFTLADWDSVDWARQTIDKLKSDFSNGAVGVKVWKNIGMTYKDSSGNFIMIDNPKLDSVIEFIISQDKTVLGHLGEPKNCWLPIEKMTVNNDREYYKSHPEYHMFLHPEYPSYEEQIYARDHFLEKNHGLCFVGAHLASLEWSIGEIANRLDKFPNMAVDLADRICHLQLQSQNDYEKVRNFILKYQDRILYSTDAGYEKIAPGEEKILTDNLHQTWIEDWKYFVADEKMTSSKVEGEFRTLHLPKEVVDKIFYGNASKWYKF